MCEQDLQQYMDAQLKTVSADEPLDCSFPQYVFTKSEKYLLRTCMNAATSAGMALALQGATTGLLGALLSMKLKSSTQLRHT